MDDSLLNLTTGNVGRELNNPQPTFHLQKERERETENPSVSEPKFTLFAYTAILKTSEAAH